MARSTEEELAFIQSLIEDNSSIICSKKSDDSTRRLKKRTWEEMVEQYNSIPEFKKKNVSQMQKCWENMKTKRKQELSQQKRARFETGGGPYNPPPKDTPLDHLIDNVTNIEIPSIDSDMIHEVASGASSRYSLSEVMKFVPTPSHEKDTDYVDVNVDEVEEDIDNPDPFPFRIPPPSCPPLSASSRLPSSHLSPSCPPLSASSCLPSSHLSPSCPPLSASSRLPSSHLSPSCPPHSASSCLPSSHPSVSTSTPSRYAKKKSNLKGPDSTVLLQGNLQDRQSLIEIQSKYYKELLVQTKKEIELKEEEMQMKEIEHELRKKKLELEITLLKENNELERNQKLEKHNLEMEKLKKM